MNSTNLEEDEKQALQLFGASVVDHTVAERNAINEYMGTSEKVPNNEEEGVLSHGSTVIDVNLLSQANSVTCGTKTPFECLAEPDVSGDSNEEGNISDESFCLTDGSFSECDDVDLDRIHKQSGKVRTKITRKRKRNEDSMELIRERDDGNDRVFEKRLSSIYEEQNPEVNVVKGDLTLRKTVWKSLYRYQKTGVRWLYELHVQCVGGILADEMGLGKTIQMIAFLRALDESRFYDQALEIRGLGPCLIVAPATLMGQWVQEIHRWMPRCRVAIFHSTGSHKGSKQALISKMSRFRRGGTILVTSYSTFALEQKLLIEPNWHYIILDEGHKIKNPDAKMTLALKEVHTPHRIIISGSPLQNSLKELWSLMDFVYPGRLGGMQSFMDKFAHPITSGGFANATPTQVQTATKCAIVLRDAINAFILRRMKADVQADLVLPQKTEQVLFCELTNEQRMLYREYLGSRECSRILSKKMDAFVGIALLRKLCNHPDFVTGGPNEVENFVDKNDIKMEFGFFERSGKMVVVKHLLDLWKKGGHRVLLFSQSRAMIVILEKMLIMESYSYLRMDGRTPVSSRQKLVDTFNQNPSITVFLLTTRVGGIGINLTAANKVVIFDPDWNPSTDVQARERAWRIGQQNEVTVYRLICSGTIEEKIYHRQIFKLFLTARVLKDPNQKRLLKTNHLYDLFSLSDLKPDDSTETAAIFSGDTEEIRKENYFNKRDNEKRDREKKRKKKLNRKRIEVEKGGNEECDDTIVDLSDERRAQLREMAKRLARNLGASSSGDCVPSCSKQENSGAENWREDVEQQKKDAVEPSSIEYTKIPYLNKKKEKKKKKKKDNLDEEEEEKKQRKASEDYVLGKLLKGKVRSALKHDDIVASGSAQIRVSHEEAENVARTAAKSIGRRKCSSSLLLASSKRLQKEYTSEEGEKSEHSEGDNDEERSFNGKREKSSFMEALKQRKSKEGITIGNVDCPKSKFERIAEELKIFVSRTGHVHTNEIVDYFKERVGAYEQPQFRALLKRMCTFDELRKRWSLKAEYT